MRFMHPKNQLLWTVPLWKVKTVHKEWKVGMWFEWNRKVWAPGECFVELRQKQKKGDEVVYWNWSRNI